MANNNQMFKDLMAVYGDSYTAMDKSKKEKLHRQYKGDRAAREAIQRQAQQKTDNQNSQIANSIQLPTISAPEITLPKRKFSTGTVEFGPVEAQSAEIIKSPIITRKFANKYAYDFIKTAEARGIDYTTPEGQQLWEQYVKYMQLPGSQLSGANANDFFNSNYAPGYYDRRKAEISQQSTARRSQAISDYAEQNGIDTSTPEGKQQAAQEWQADTYAKSKQGQYDKQVQNLNDLDAAVAGTLLGGVAVGTGGIPALLAMGAGYGGNYLTDKAIASTTDYSSWNDAVRSTGLFNHVQPSPAGQFYSDLAIDATNPGGIASASVAGTLSNNWLNNGINPVQFARRFGQDVRAGVFNTKHGPVYIDADASTNVINGQKGAYSRWHKVRLTDPEAMPEGYDSGTRFVSESKTTRKVGNDRQVFDKSSMFDGHLVEEGIQGEYRPFMGEVTNNAAGRPVVRHPVTGQFSKAPMLRYADVWADPWQIRPGIGHFNSQKEFNFTPTVTPHATPDNRVVETETYRDPWDIEYGKQPEGTVWNWRGDPNSSRPAGLYLIKRTKPGMLVGTRRRVGVGEGDSRGTVGTVANDSTTITPQVIVNPDLGRTVQLVPGNVNVNDQNIGPEIIPMSRKGSKLVPKAFLGIRFGKSNIEKAYEADRTAALNSEYGDLMKDKKTRKWAEKDYNNKWVNSTDRNNFQYGTQLIDIDDRLAAIRAENDAKAIDFATKVENNSFYPTKDIVDTSAPDPSDAFFQNLANEAVAQVPTKPRQFRDSARRQLDEVVVTDRQPLAKPDMPVAPIQATQTAPAAQRRGITGKDLMRAFDNYGTGWTFAEATRYQPMTLSNGVMIRNNGNFLNTKRQYSVDNGVTWKDYNDYVGRSDRRDNSALNTWYD